MRSQLQQALSDIDRGIELFEQSAQGNLTRGERKRLARKALKVRVEFDSLIADLLAELQRRHLNEAVRGAHRLSLDEPDQRCRSSVEGDQSRPGSPDRP